MSGRSKKRHLRLKRCKCKKTAVLVKKELSFINGSKHIAAICESCGGLKNYIQREENTLAHIKTLSLGELQSYVITFGKYAGMTILDIALEDPDYLMWLYNSGGKSKPANMVRAFMDYDLSGGI